MEQLEKEAVRLTAVIRASEDWSKEYAKDPATHARLIKLEGRWEWALRKLFKSFAEEVKNGSTVINWYQYYSQVRSDYNVTLIVPDDSTGQWEDQFIQVSLDLVTEIVATGAIAGEAIYSRPLGITSTEEAIQRLGTDQVAKLVGKHVLPDGTIIDNPDKVYSITETIRNDILASIKRSLQLGEDIQTAIDRVYGAINNRSRAELIARTESVNAYQAGLRRFALSAGMKGKVWQDVGAKDKCREYAALGPVPIDYTYDGLDGPTAHPHCRCGMRYIDATEWANRGDQ
jgi:hypothetical protein